jgi:hypothetical protein
MRAIMDAGIPDHVERRRMITGYTDGLTIQRERTIVEFPDGTRAPAADLNNIESIAQTFRGTDTLDIVIRVQRPASPTPTVRVFVDGFVGLLRRSAPQVPFTAVFSDVAVAAAP